MHDTVTAQFGSQSVVEQSRDLPWPACDAISEPPPLVKSKKVEKGMLSPPGGSCVSSSHNLKTPRLESEETVSTQVTSSLASPIITQQLSSPKHPVPLEPSPVAARKPNPVMSHPSGSVVFNPAPVVPAPMTSPPGVGLSPSQTSVHPGSPTNWYPAATVIASPNQPSVQFIPQPYAVSQPVLTATMVQPAAGLDMPHTTMAAVAVPTGSAAAAAAAISTQSLPVAHAAGENVQTVHYAPASTAMPYPAQPLFLHRVPPATGPQYIQLTALPLTPSTIRQANAPDSRYTNAMTADSVMTAHDGIDADVASARQRRLYADVSADPAAVRLPSGRIAYSCRSCKLTFLWRRHLEQHFTAHRSHRKPTLCHICGKCFPRPDHVNRHASSRHTTIVYPCQLCGQEFSRIYNLHKHWRDQHSAQMERVNDDSPSDSTSASEEDYEDAIVKTESQSEDVDVTSTPAAAKSPVFSPGSDKPLNAMFSQLMTTSMPHTGTGGTSPRMDTDSVSPSAAAVHKMTLAPMRRGVRGAPNLPRRFACMTCNRRFARSAHLHRHQRIHTGEKPFRCFKCGRSYARGDYLRSHLTCQHNQTPMPCEICGEKFETITELNDHQKLRHGRMRAWFLQPGLKGDFSNPSFGAYVASSGVAAAHDDEEDEDDDDGNWSLCGDVDKLDQGMSEDEHEGKVSQSSNV